MLSSLIGMDNVAQIPIFLEPGDPQTAEQLLPLLYEELRRLAAQKLAAESPDQTLQATALVHEAFLRLVPAAQNWDSRGHFFAAAAEAMRRILIERARRKQSLKGGGPFERNPLDDLAAPEDRGAVDLLDLDEALRELEREDPLKAQLVKLRFFAGLSVDETANTLNISVATTKRYWAYARVWLYGRINRK